MELSKSKLFNHGISHQFRFPLRQLIKQNRTIERLYLNKMRRPDRI